MTNTYKINTSTLKSKILDKTLSFPPTSRYKFTITPDKGRVIQAAQYTAKEMLLSYEGDVNSHTKLPSRLEWVMLGLGELDNTISGFKEFPAFYKIVFEDSTNPSNDPNWDVNNYKGNTVYMWIYFGGNEVTFIKNLTNTNLVINVDYNSTPITQSKVTNPTSIAINSINSFNI